MFNPIQFLRRPRRPDKSIASPRRRGTILIMALGVVGIISIAALSYVTVVRLDRRSAIAAARSQNFRQQVNAVVAQIQALLTADMFGNKIVTPNVPRESWPRIFEDGEYWDYPTTETDITSKRFTYLDEDPSVPLANISNSDPAVLRKLGNSNPNDPSRLFEVAFPDDAWLASVDPFVPELDGFGRYTNIKENNIEHMPQFTNLRSGYIYDEGDPDNINDDRWVRQDGRFVDLAQWFLSINNTDGFANPGINLRDWGEISNESIDNNPKTIKLGPEFGVNQEVFNLQMNLLGEDDPEIPPASRFTNLSQPALDDIFDAGDERQWADTDGDLRPDARWTTLESLGNLFGLNWVVAARIIDASAFINVNSSLEFGSSNLQRMGDGRTPADVDLLRLLREAAIFNSNSTPKPYYFDRVQVDLVNSAFHGHLNSGIPMFPLVRDASRFDKNRTFGYFNPTSENYATPGAVSPRDHRFSFYHLFGSSNTRSISASAEHLPERDIVDLFSFWGTNNASILSRTEQRFDSEGDFGTGYLPDGTLNLDLGPLRARELPENIRVFGAALPTPIDRGPTNAELLDNNPRRNLTTASGTGPVSPVPVLNRATTGTGAKIREVFAGTTRREKIRLDKPLTVEETQRAFEAFVWALAPLATDQPLFRPADGREPKIDTHFRLGHSSYHYGGGLGGPASVTLVNPVPGLRTYGDTRIVPGSITPAFWPFLPDYALYTAASLAVNLRDAVDRDNRPSVVQFFFTPEPTPSTPNAKLPGAIEFNTRFAHGDIWLSTAEAADSRLVQQIGPGANNPTDGVIFVGLDRQPFLTEVTTIAIYSDFDDATLGHSGDMSGVIGDSLADQVGSAIIVELSNPWSTDIKTDNHIVEIVNASVSPIQLGGPGAVRLLLDNDVVIPRGRSRLFMFHTLGQNDLWDLTYLDDITANLPESPALARLDPLLGDGGPVAFQTIADGTPNPVVLVTRSNTGRLVVIDRMSPNPKETELRDRLFPTVGPFVLGGTDADNVGGTLDDGYFQALGYDIDGTGANGQRDTRLNTGIRTGRAMVTSSLSRAMLRPQFGGFPAYVLEDRTRNRTSTRWDAHAWLEPFPAADQNDIDPALISRLTPLDLISGAPIFPSGFPDDRWDFSPDGFVKPRSDLKWGISELPSFQLFVPAPDAPYTRNIASPGKEIRFGALSELHMLSTYAHFYQTNKLDTITQNIIDNLDLLTTVGEWLGQSRIHDHGKQVPVLPQDINPYMGVLDPTRYILGESGMILPDDLPSHLAVPLATRVFDCFDVLPVSDPDGLVQGKININTAPNKVLQMLPMVDPSFQAINLNPILKPKLEFSQRLRMIEQYRNPAYDPAGPSDLFNPQNKAQENLTGMTGLRVANITGDNSFPGFAALGELAILDRWAPPGVGVPRTFATAPGVPTSGFLRLGSNAIKDDFAPVELVTDYARPEYNPQDDPEERLALFRAISNIVTTRSDVFIAWFVLRGYDPEVIEQIRISPDTINNALAEMENSLTFRPAYESRWLAVLDRSNVKRPDDRPEVLMLLELPPTSP